MNRAALYARVSTERQKDEQTIGAQIHEIKQAIEADGCILIDDCIYQDEGWSGAFLERPELDRLRQDAKLNKFDILYVFDRGRLSRKFLYQEIVKEELAHSGVAFKSLHDVNGTSPEEQLMGNVMGVFHEYERVKIAERFRLGKLNKVRNGNLLGYIAPYGYNYVPIQGKGLNKKNGYFVVDEEEAKTVRMMFEWVGTEGVSLKEVIRRLYKLGIPPKKQRRPNWTKGPVFRLLTNETYIGKHHYYKMEAVVPKNPTASTVKKYHHRTTNKTSRRPRSKDEWLMVKVPKIVDDELFAKTQKQLEQNAKYNVRNKKHPFLLSGLIYCTCGERRVGDGPAGKKYYRCTGRLKSFPLPAKCKLGGINATVLDAVCWQKIVELLTDNRLLEQQINRYLQKQSEETRKGPTNTEIKHNFKALKDEEARYAKMYGQKLMSDDVYIERIDSVRQRREALALSQTQNDELATKLTEIKPEDIIEPFKAFINTMDFKEKQFTSRKIIDKLVATKEEVKICGFIPLFESPATKKVNHEPIYRHRRPPQRRQVNPF